MFLPYESFPSYDCEDNFTKFKRSLFFLISTQKIYIEFWIQFFKLKFQKQLGLAIKIMLLYCRNCFMKFTVIQIWMKFVMVLIADYSEDLEKFSGKHVKIYACWCKIRRLRRPINLLKLSFPIHCMSKIKLYYKI